MTVFPVSPFKSLLTGLERLKQRRNRRSVALAALPPPLAIPQLPAPSLASPQPPRIPPAFDNLPPELIIQILDSADVPSLLHCSAVCRRFRDIVSASSAMRYRVALLVAGLEDAGGPSSVSDRLRALQLREASWRNFHYRNRVTREIGPGAYRPCYDLHGGVFFVGRRTGPNLPIRMLSWLPLPSTRDPPGVPPTWRSVPLDISIDDFALDLHQDLVVLVEMLLPGTTTLQVHLRAFQTLQPHPRAAAGLLTAECDPVSVNSTIVIDLTGCLLGLLFNYDHTGFTDKDALTVWDWTTGQMLCRLQNSHSKLTSFLFLAEDMFLVPNVGDSTIEVYRRNDQTFELAATFDLPPQADGCTLHNANSRYKSRGVFRPSSPPSAPASEDACMPTERTFYLSPEKELVIFSLEYRAKGDSHYFTLITQKEIFLRAGRTQADAPARVQWRTWGPSGTRIIREPLRLWDYFFAGTRFITLTASDAGGVDDEDSDEGLARELNATHAHVRVLDFNPFAVAQAVECPDPTRRVRTVREPCGVREGKLFSEDVRTSLPYVETTTTGGFPQLANVMCDHERVIGLQTNAMLDMQSLDVFLL
ncbi:hypothetical protein EXIGLDRAFT_722751 [Exidia glandulosa HHB12029]|uniref:F-box domain-containing protein n=1 Tax=Exidia glandulosa HHB12029 TaxID=1314781 RepID=A0A165F4F6_EXIGL|nr:hypothetical protein EXIGLDRAFT_722751 [Exidia glandulosa HHB12029]